MYLVKKHVNKGELTCIFKYKGELVFSQCIEYKEHPYSVPPSTTEGFYCFDPPGPTTLLPTAYCVGYKGR